jgi:uncharacterized protein
VRRVNALLLAVAAVYLLVLAAVWVLQERLLFYPQPAPASVAPPPGWHVDEVALRARDGAVLRGVLARPPGLSPGAVIYFGGNAEEVTSNATQAEALYGARAVLFVNYRGYGRSDGVPGEKALVADAAELFDWLARQPGIDATRIAVHGRSLGSGIAVQLARDRPIACVVLTTPFDSALEVARQVYPWIPVGWLMRHPFDSAAVAPALRMPALILAASGDTLVRPERSERLAQAWGGPVERRTFEGYGHGDIDAAPGYPAGVRAFIDRCLRAA